MRKLAQLDIIVRLAIFALWASSLTLPVWRERLDAGWDQGWQILEIGWIGPTGLQFGWFGNLLLVAYVISPTRGVVRALVCSTMLVLFFLCGWLFTVMPNDEGGRQIVTWGSGYHAWMTAIALTALYCYIRAFAIEDELERAPDLQKRERRAAAAAVGEHQGGASSVNGYSAS